ncbi:histidine kinase [Methylobacterium sp. AMS5]|uniref:sensor histidine kinase n=1 Tax=Methylobacterium sp. AMS5 TaxID=925818 RepID=UPI00074F85E6|nr:histidine kinase [Methylobacterium sp. AMS5]AMB47051.1 histidine kinase [Methylobacterium sp. AMS5]
MRLLTGLILRVVGVVVLCLVAASAWVMWDVSRTIQGEAAASADRVVREARELAWRELTWRGSSGRDAKYAFPDWRSSETLRVIAPGYCVSLAWTDEAPRRLCGGWSGMGAAPPAWFDAAYAALFGPSLPVNRTVTLHRRDAGQVIAVADHGAAARQAWRVVSVALGVAAAMAAGIGLLATLVIGHALMPAERIVRSLRRMERGAYDLRLPAFRAQEFALIARAVNDLTQRLAENTAQRAALTRRLFQVQEEERRALARDLHDEFGQCLTAASALAAAIAAGTAEDRSDIAEDARAISGITERMMSTLRSTLARLRPPDLDEVGLERCLDHLVATWNARGVARAAARTSAPALETIPAFRLDIVGNLSHVPTQAALSLYRVAQECLTNAVRHGRPSEVRLRVEGDDPARGLALSVEDDGGGAPECLEARPGYGLVGIRERVAALGGSLSIERPAGGIGVRVAAIIPLAAPDPAGARFA